MVIFLVELALILLLVLFYLRKEIKISVRYFRHGDIIWVRDRSLKPQRAVLSKWNDSTFCYMLDGSYDLKFKRWFFLARNEYLTYIEIGERMDISPLTVKTHMARALNHIKSYLAKNGEVFFGFLVLPANLF